MASVITSARTSTASVFDVVTQSANAVSKLIGTAALGIDALDAKTKLMHCEVISDTASRMVNVKSHAAVNAAVEHADFMQEVFRRQNPDATFDWNSCYNSAVVEIQAAVNAA